MSQMKKTQKRQQNEESQNTQQLIEALPAEKKAALDGYLAVQESEQSQRSRSPSPIKLRPASGLGGVGKGVKKPMGEVPPHRYAPTAGKGPAVSKNDDLIPGSHRGPIVVGKKGLKGVGFGKGTKRHGKVRRDNINGITKPAIRRLARRGGVKRISGLVYEETRSVLKNFLETVIRDVVTYTEHAKRKTARAMDVVYALKRQGRTLYGFN